MNHVYVVFLVFPSNIDFVPKIFHVDGMRQK